MFKDRKGSRDTARLENPERMNPIVSLLVTFCPAISSKQCLRP